MDKYIPLWELPPDWRGNCFADKEADQGYIDGSEVTHVDLARCSPYLAWYTPSSVEDSEPVLVNFSTWARQAVRHHLSEQYLSTHPLMEDIDWEATADLRVVSDTYTERLKLMKLMWHLYAYGH
jgi:hypothetical protein